jgi:hypothetical protein
MWQVLFQLMQLLPHGWSFLHDFASTAAALANSMAPTRAANFTAAILPSRPRLAGDAVMIGVMLRIVARLARFAGARPTECAAAQLGAASMCFSCDRQRPWAARNLPFEVRGGEGGDDDETAPGA